MPNTYAQMTFGEIEFILTFFIDKNYLRVETESRAVTVPFLCKILLATRRVGAMWDSECFPAHDSRKLQQHEAIMYFRLAGEHSFIRKKRKPGKTK